MKLAYSILTAIISFAFIVNFVQAHNDTDVDLNSLDLQELVNAYNKNLDKVPGFVKNIFGNERINLYIGDEAFVGLVGTDGNITEYKRGGIDGPTMKIHTTADTLHKLVDGDKTLLEATKDKSITYEGVGLSKKIKFGFIKFFQSIFFRG